MRGGLNRENMVSDCQLNYNVVKFLALYSALAPLPLHIIFQTVTGDFLLLPVMLVVVLLQYSWQYFGDHLLIWSVVVLQVPALQLSLRICSPTIVVCKHIL